MTDHIPMMLPVQQQFDESYIVDVRHPITQGFAQYADGVIKEGMRVAITAGSRGITHIAHIVAAVVEEVRCRGGEPFVIAAMGSHGGATADGQRTVLEGYGITEATLGCPISASMDTVCVGETTDHVSVFVDRAAHESDAIILLNRVKPHSILTGNLGSGLMKMAGIGLGKRDGADAIHTKGLAEHLIPAARLVLARAPVQLGVAIVENALHQPWKIVVVPTPAIEATDQTLLAEARAILPNIPFDPIDVLVVDQMGKNFSGTGMDPNVIGMHRRIGGTPQRSIRRIVALDLSPESHGNANGVGMADIITETLREKIDWHATYTNALTADFLSGVKIPYTCPSVWEAIALACKPFTPATIRAVRISNTAHLQQFWVSPTLWQEIDHLPLLTHDTTHKAIPFDIEHLP
ncbi:MAG: DUF2088 domain-containing protein [Chloroflexi bacterium AL-W]|nr:DUF2088 domain-containing protein [Chloroflexi bacterium AL-N1]NOK71685.1 DUF2088 domain-containing protein [Chloroflexi bacterium AL-N10]NOK79026.1 DUF2088 domain-containing protein [Chloroflexi bacterium AL-N5]NOK86460.1 DUF2088 domain-containing protein [Chloroflexi bacterium AL-W]NOK93426.1 DUF2088 domain-containing protein [Chloroflexi bacterium AL-N15]